jgi:hypothetical protein
MITTQAMQWITAERARERQATGKTWIEKQADGATKKKP